MSLDNVQKKILDVLENVESKNFEKFLFMLTDGSKKPCIRASEVERKSYVEITKLLVSRCTESGAVDRTIQTLRETGCNNEAQELEQWNKTRLDKLRPSFRRTSTGLLELKPTVEAQSAVTNRTTVQEIQDVQQIHDEYPKDNLLELGQCTLPFGQYEGKSFKWLLENDVGYAASVLGTYLKDRKDGKTPIPHMKSKDALTKYVAFFPDVEKEAQLHSTNMRRGSGNHLGCWLLNNTSYIKIRNVPPTSPVPPQTTSLAPPPTTSPVPPSSMQPMPYPSPLNQKAVSSIGGGEREDSSQQAVQNADDAIDMHSLARDAK